MCGSVYNKYIIYAPFPSSLCFLSRWLWRQRIRLHLEGRGINPTPVDLHEQQLSLEQHSQAHRITTMDMQQSTLPSPAACTGSCRPVCPQSYCLDSPLIIIKNMPNKYVVVFVFMPF